ncbi:hypothetical protein DM01DRAFT_1376420 [Hesseltinella vesiculosa]|uniref:Rrp44-like cold shock domain-containing protein n=1 Tax=Hesseltinella vesiculosa TaxID=101127 RepID=A0A1X2GAC6_9FUNG|nr:hypothetical protein DM01DRAFT_1376420 [Hesseltinella vesiculosa]
MSFGEETREKHSFSNRKRNMDDNLPHSPSSPSIDASSLQAQRSLSFVDSHGHVDMPSRQYRPPSRPPSQRHQFERFMGRDKVEKALAQGELDVFVCNARTHNRALEGDLVAIQLLDVNQVWKQCTDRDVRHREKQQQDHNHEPATASDNNDDNS